MIYWIIITLVSLLFLFTIIPIFKYEVWWVRGFDFPRLQVFCFSVLILILEVIFLPFAEYDTWLILGVTLLCAIYQAWWIAPYTIFYPKEVEDAANSEGTVRIKVMVANVLTPNKNVNQLLSFVQQYEPDVLGLVETDAWWEEKLETLEADYPHTLKCPLENLYGMHIYSRLPLTDTKIQFLVEDDVPSMHVLLNLPNGQKIGMHCVHPAPPSPTENEKSSERDAELIIVAKSVAESNLPAIVTGDLNDVAWSATTRLFRKISGLLDPRVGRGMFSTFHAKYPMLRWPLDHFFHSDHFKLVRIIRLPYFGSDHFPIFIELAYTPITGDDQEGLEADEDDEKWAEEKMQEEQVDEDDVHMPGE